MKNPEFLSVASLLLDPMGHDKNPRMRLIWLLSKLNVQGLQANFQL
jgi:hypothetical protein